jgi:two-component sensor histidine kinase
VTCEAEPLSWPAARAGALATIAAELAINAAKHAPTGRITLRLSAAAGSGGDALLAAEDEGAGFPADLDLSQASGLGMRLIRTLAGPGEGRVSVDHAARGGRIVVRVAASG